MAVVTTLLLACVMLQSGSIAGPSMTAAQDDKRESTAATRHTEIRLRAAGKDKVVSLSFQDADLREVLHTLAEIGGVSIIIDPEVKGTVTAELAGVRWHQAFHAILRTHGLAAEVEGQIWSGDGLDGCRPEKPAPKAQPAAAGSARTAS